MKEKLIDAPSGKKKKRPKSLRAAYRKLNVVSQEDYRQRTKDFNPGIVLDIKTHMDMYKQRIKLRVSGKRMKQGALSGLQCFQPEVLEKYGFTRLDLLVEKVFKGSRFIINSTPSMIEYIIAPTIFNHTSTSMAYLRLPQVETVTDGKDYKILENTNQCVLNVMIKPFTHWSTHRNSYIIPLDAKDALSPKKKDFDGKVRKAGHDRDFYAHLLLAAIDTDKGSIKYEYADGFYSYKGLEAGFINVMHVLGGLNLYVPKKRD